MPDEILYTPPEMPPAIHELGAQLNSAKYGFEKIEESIAYSKDGIQYESELSAARAEIAEDNTIFEDISDAVQEKTGQVEPYAKDELAPAIRNMDIYALPIDEASTVPELVAGIDLEGFYYSANPADRTSVLFGVDSNNDLYVTKGSDA